jgi:DNA-directed RNA polymerase III subunit RPC4
MPPKGSGSARRGSTRGRGRGRGRGGASGSAPPPADVQSESQSTITSSPAIKSEPDAVVTPEHSRDENNQEPMDLDPNSSPATQPTETPAPTPIRPLSSMQMQSPAIASGSGTRGGAKKESKFKPKNVRRGQEELNALEKKERERRAALAAQQQHTVAAIGVLSYRGRGRGRGDPMGMGRGRGMTKSTSSGVFSVLPAELG